MPFEDFQERERERKVIVLPIRAMVARYIAVVMLDKKTTA